MLPVLHSHQRASLGLRVNSEEEIDLRYSFALPLSPPSREGGLVLIADPVATVPSGRIEFESGFLTRGSTHQADLRVLGALEIRETIGKHEGDALLRTYQNLHAIRLEDSDFEKQPWAYHKMRLCDPPVSPTLLSILTVSMGVPFRGRGCPEIEIGSAAGFEHYVTDVWLRVSYIAALTSGACVAIRYSSQRGRSVEPNKQYPMLSATLNGQIGNLLSACRVQIRDLAAIGRRGEDWEADDDEVGLQSALERVIGARKRLAELSDSGRMNDSSRDGIRENVDLVVGICEELRQVVVQVPATLASGHSLWGSAHTIVPQFRPAAEAIESSRRLLGLQMLIPLVALLVATLGINYGNPSPENYEDALTSFLLLFPALNLAAYPVLRDRRFRLRRLDAYQTSAITLVSAMPLLLAGLVVFVHPLGALSVVSLVLLAMAGLVAAIAWLGLSSWAIEASGRRSARHRHRSMVRQLYNARVEAYHASGATKAD